MAFAQAATLRGRVARLEEVLSAAAQFIKGKAQPHDQSPGSSKQPQAQLVGVAHAAACTSRLRARHAHWCLSLHVQLHLIRPVCQRLQMFLQLELLQQTNRADDLQLQLAKQEAAVAQLQQRLQCQDGSGEAEGQASVPGGEQHEGSSQDVVQRLRAELEEACQRNSLLQQELQREQVCNTALL